MIFKPEQLIEHPEGGRFQEVFRSALKVETHGGRRRDALTHIHFQLKATECSLFHRVASDEVWNLYQGKLDLHLWDGHDLNTIRLSPDEPAFCHVVPAGLWQATTPVDGDLLVGCSVGPGFDFEDFDLMRDDPEAKGVFLEKHPDLAHLVG